MESLLPQVYGELTNYLNVHKAVSGEELTWKISLVVNSLSEGEQKRLAELLGGDAKQLIFDGITGEYRLSVFSPDMHVAINYLGEVFYTPPTHRYEPDEIAKAYRRLIDLRFPKISQILEDSVTDLMKKSGYDLSEVMSQKGGAHKSLKACKDNDELDLLIFPSIVFVSDNLTELQGATSETAVIVPAEKSPAPFVNFIRENRDAVRENIKMMIWVVGLDQKTTSPFLGKPRDTKIWGNFKDPEKSLLATELWVKGTMRSRVLDEDF